MAAILRVKRKKDEEPMDTLLISCKRQKIESNNPLSAIIKFAGTIEKQEDNIVKHIRKIFSKDILKENFKQHIVDITKKTREKTKQESNENRYKIINKIRSIDTSLIEDLEEDFINIIDIEETKPPLDDKSDINYVYDLYYTKTQKALEIDDLLSVEPVEDDLIFEDYYEKVNGKKDESEDSNSESNWRNDYPDSDNSEGSFGENDIKNAMKILNIEDMLSSDSDEFVYGLDESDVERYGHKYAKYKARMIQEEKEYDNILYLDYNTDNGES